MHSERKSFIIKVAGCLLLTYEWPARYHNKDVVLVDLSGGVQGLHKGVFPYCLKALETCCILIDMLDWQSRRFGPMSRANEKAKASGIHTIS